MVRSNCGSDSEEKIGIPGSRDSSLACNSDWEKSVGPSTSSWPRMHAKKNDFLRASPIAQYWRASH